MIPFDPAYILTAFQQIFPFLPVTMGVVLSVMLFGTVLGISLAMLQLFSRRFGSLAAGYVFLMRCTPPIVLIFLVYYGIPKLLLLVFQINVNNWHKGIFVVTALTLLFAATIAEVFKSAYKAIPQGQREAGVSMGLTEFQTFYRILFPQAAVIALPNYTTAVLNLMKDGALAYTVGLIDLMGAGNNLIARNLGNYAIETYLALALIYWGLAALLEGIASLLERALGKGRVVART